MVSMSMIHANSHAKCLGGVRRKIIVCVHTKMADPIYNQIVENKLICIYWQAFSYIFFIDNLSIPFTTKANYFIVIYFVQHPSLFTNTNGKWNIFYYFILNFKLNTITTVYKVSIMYTVTKNTEKNMYNPNSAQKLNNNV